LKLSITNIHIRYEDTESNLGHPFAAGLTLAKLGAVTVDEDGREIFVTGGALDRIQKASSLIHLFHSSFIHRFHMIRIFH
jgi:vacuolar protein sorting-associated protein 13A/C